MRFGAGDAKAALPFTATRSAKAPVSSRMPTPIAIAGSICASTGRPGTAWAESRITSRATAMEIAAVLPATTLQAALRMFIEPAIAKRKMTPMPAAVT